MTPVRLHDAHLHLQDSRLRENVEEVLHEAKLAGVESMVINGTSPDDWNIVADRFNKRGDPIQNLASLHKLYKLFSEAAEELQHHPGVTVIRSEVDKHLVQSLINQYHAFERKSVYHLRDSMLQMIGTSAANQQQEVIGLNFVHYDTGDFADIDEMMLMYEKEKEYYQKIENKVFKKIKAEMQGQNEYERKEGLESRRFIYTDDSCISLAHFLIRDGCMDVKFFLRSSNVKDTLKYDLNFIKHISKEVFQYFKCDRQGDYCKIEVLVNSGHVV